MELRFYATVFSLLLVFLPSICTGQDFNVKESTSLSLRDAIREVAEVTNVLPLDVYAGTTLSEYRNWNCRYDLTYSEFRPNYALYEIARNASVSEVLECVEELADMPAKEKALTCAALIAFVESQREREARGIVPATGLSDDEKRLVLQKLEQELNDRAVAFPKADNAELNARWEAELREECGNYIRLCKDRTTATSACLDIFLVCGEKYDVRDIEEYESWILRRSPNEQLSESQKKKFENRRYFNFATWNSDVKQFPVEFLCALVLAQATYAQDLFCNRPHERNGIEIEEENAFFENVEKRKAEAVVGCFKRCRSNVEPERTWSYPLDAGLLSWDYGHSNPESLIMSAYLRTQFIAARYGMPEEEAPVCGNSSDKNVLVADVAQKTIDALINDIPHVAVASVWEPQEESNDVEKQEHLPLLEAIQSIAAEDNVYLSVEFLFNLFKRFEEKKRRHDVMFSVCLADTYERCRPLFSFYEATKQTTHDEVVECLRGFDNLSVKEKAFALTATSLYILRSESAVELEETPKREEFRTLSIDEKERFAQLLRTCGKDDTVVFESVSGTMEDWEASFRKLALDFQKKLGKWNPYYVYSPDTKERWERFCNEVPTVLLYSMLSMETCCNLYDLRVMAGIKPDFSTTSMELKIEELCDGPDVDVTTLPEKMLEELKAMAYYRYQEPTWITYVTDENVLSEIKMMRYYLYRNSDLANRCPYDTRRHGTTPSPRFSTVSRMARLCDVARKIRYSAKVFCDLFPEN